jgi:Tol biopolymer transport system component
LEGHLLAINVPVGLCFLNKMPIQTEEHPIGSLPVGAIPESLVISENNRHFACVAVESGKLRAVYDGAEGPLYDGIHKGTPILSPNGEHFAYVAECSGGGEAVVLNGMEGPRFEAIVEDRLCFSPDSKRLAYVGFRDQQMVAVVDGQESESYDWVFQGPSFFSPDSRRVCFIGQRGDHMTVVLDGIAEEPVTAILAGYPVFAPDSSRVAYIAQIGGKPRTAGGRSIPQGMARFSGGQTAVMCGGVLHPVYDEISGGLHFSADGSRLGYTGIRGGRAYINVDGVESGPYDAVAERMPIFSPDGRRVAYVILNRGQSVVVIDGVHSPSYKEVGAGTPIFSPDGKRVAYVVMKGAKAALVLDGQEQEAKYRYIQKHAMAFSPDSKRLAFSARPGLLGLKGCVEVDGKTGPTYLAVDLSAPVFSPDSRRVAYMASPKWNRSLAVVDGVEGTACNKFSDGTLRFSPDGAFVVYLAEMNGRAAIMVDGIPGEQGVAVFPREGTILRGSAIVFDEDRIFRVLVLRPNREIRALEVKVTL